MGNVASLGVFMGLLLVPGSPGVLGKESMTALVVWTLLGVVFFLMRRRHNKTLTDEQVDILVLGAPRPEGTKLKSGTPAVTPGA